MPRHPPSNNSGWGSRETVPVDGVQFKQHGAVARPRSTSPGLDSFGSSASSASYIPPPPPINVNHKGASTAGGGIGGGGGRPMLSNVAFTFPGGGMVGGGSGSVGGSQSTASLDVAAPPSFSGSTSNAPTRPIVAPTTSYQPLWRGRGEWESAAGGVNVGYTNGKNDIDDDFYPSSGAVKHNASATTTTTMTTTAAVHSMGSHLLSQPTLPASPPPVGRFEPHAGSARRFGGGDLDSDSPGPASYSPPSGTFDTTDTNDAHRSLAHQQRSSAAHVDTFTNIPSSNYGKTATPTLHITSTTPQKDSPSPPRRAPTPPGRISLGGGGERAEKSPLIGSSGMNSTGVGVYNSRYSDISSSSPLPIASAAAPVAVARHGTVSGSASRELGGGDVGYSLSRIGAGGGSSKEIDGDEVSYWRSKALELQIEKERLIFEKEELQQKSSRSEYSAAGLAQAERHIAQLQEQLAEEEARSATHLARVTELEKERGKLRDKVSEVEVDLDRLTREIEKHQAEVIITQQLEARIKSMQTFADAEHERMQTLINEQRDEIAQLRTRLRDAQGQRKDKTGIARSSIGAPASARQVAAQNLRSPARKSIAPATPRKEDRLNDRSSDKINDDKSPMSFVLQHNVERLEAELKEVRSQNANLEQQCAELRRELARCAPPQEISRWRERMIAQEREIESLRVQLREGGMSTPPPPPTPPNASMTSMDVSVMYQDEAAEMRARSNAAAKLESVLNDANQQIEKLMQQLQDREAGLRSAQLHVDALTEQNADLGHRLRTAHGQAQGMHEELERWRNDRGEELDIARRENEQLAGDVRRLQHEVQKEQKMKGLIDRKLSLAQKRVRELEGRPEERRGGLPRTARSNNSTDELLSSLSSPSHSHSSLNSSLAAQREQERQELESSLQEANARYAQLYQNYDILHQQLQTAEAHIHQMDVDNQKLRAAVAAREAGGGGTDATPTPRISAPLPTGQGASEVEKYRVTMEQLVVRLRDTQQMHQRALILLNARTSDLQQLRNILSNHGSGVSGGGGPHVHWAS